MTGLDEATIERVRHDTPAVATLTHLNHAGASLSPDPVLNVYIDHLRREARIGGYEAADEATEREEAVYTGIAGLIGARSDEIARAEHATAAWNAGFWSLPMARGQRIVTAEAAYGANAVASFARDRYGVEIDVTPSDPDGQVDLVELEHRLDADVALVAITHVPTNGGLVNPAAEIGRLTRPAGIPYLLDACQSVGQMTIDVDEIGCDLLSATGRKFLRGPRATGFLYVRSSLLDQLTPDHPDHHGAIWDDPDGYTLQDSARRFEHWEYNHAAWLALGRAVDYARDLGLDHIEASVTQKADRLRDGLDRIGLPVFDIGRKRCGIVTTAVPGRDPREVRDSLRAQSITTSVTQADGTLWDFTRRDLDTMLRMSVHYLTTEDEVDTALAALEAMS